MLWVLVLGAILIWAPPAAITHRTTFERVHGQINPKPCSVNGIEGTCMFVYECMKSEGRSVGMCVDNFMFGSCCSHNISANTVLPHNNNHPNVLYSPTTKYPSSSLRPPSLTYSTKPPHSSAGSSLSSLSALNSKVRPSKPVSFVTRTTKRPPVTIVTKSTTVSSTTPRPTPGIRPWTQKPPPFVTSSSTSFSSSSSHPSTSSSPSSSSTLRPSSSTLRPVSSSPSGGKLPSSTNAYTSVYDLIATSRPTTKTNATSSAFPDEGSTVDPFTMLTAESGPAWATAKPGWSTYQSHNQLITSSQSAKPEILSSGKPNSYVSRPSWQSSTEAFFVTRPRPSSNLSQRPRPTRRPVTEPTTEPSTTSSAVAPTSTTTTTSTTPSTTSTTSTESPEVSSLPTTTLLPGLANYQYNGQCGVAALSPRPEMRIVGGKNAAFGGWPWQVSVRRTSFFGFSSTHRCGGALINENWIATAGHCVDDLLTSQIRIRVGEYDFSSVQEPLPFVEKAVAKKIVHPKYNFYTYEYDLALVKLESSLEFQPHISPICLPASDDLLIGENATVTGWGRLSEGGTLPSVLQQVSVPIVSNEKCKSMFLRAGRHEFIPEIFLCAGYDTGGQDSCQGDSGGPLQVKGKNGRYFLAGIISWGIGCAEANLPGVCTRISKFVPWILENVT